MKTLLRYFAHKTHNIQTQLICASLYGLLDLYGYYGAFAILLKARKTQQQRIIVKRRKTV